jgi:dienelactone hydrolase
MGTEPASQTVAIPVGGGRHIAAEVVVPEGAYGLVLFAHGSGSSRRSPRNRHLAARLQARGLATVLVDLLAPGEEQQASGEVWLRSDVPFLAERLIEVTHWLEQHPALGRLPRGLIGSHTGAAAALVAAALRPEGVRAVVCRGGRAELAGQALSDVLAPTLLVVGSLDEPMVELNRSALERLACVRQLELVGGASHLFEEPGALDRVAELAGGWFERHLPAARIPAEPTQPA